jgi:nucleoside phosphorylase
VVADGLTFAVATTAEERAARKAGLRVQRIGLGGANGLPDGPLVSFGLAGALSDQLACGDVIDARRIVDPLGGVIWEGDGMGVEGARAVTVAAVASIVDDAGDRRRLREQTGADAIDMESGRLAATGRLVGCVRVISDTPSRPLGEVDGLVRPDGTVDALRGIRFLRRLSFRMIRQTAAALKVLERTAKALA